MLVTGVALACGSITSDLNGVIAIETFIPPDNSGNLDLGDTLFPRARALNGAGDSVAAQIYWDDLDTLVRIIDSTTGAVVGKFPATAQIQARVGNLRSNPQSVTVFARADTAFADTATRNPDSISVSTKPDSLSDSLLVHLRTFTDTDTVGISGRAVKFKFLYPPNAGFLLVPGDSVADSVSTDQNGLAVVQVRLKNRTLPDSAVVQATATRFNGATVHGAPIIFVVRFYP